eukprot:15326311-Ditylum_brightwellii.AAC.1
MARSCLTEGLEEEIRLTLEEKHKEWEGRRDMNKFPDEEPLTYKEWLLLPPGHVKKRVAIIVSFDMGWQHHGFCLLSWYTFMIGAQSSNIIDAVVSAKECAKCKAAKKKNMLAKKHKCPKNYNGSSKATEDDAAFVLTQRLYDEKSVLVQKIVADNA